MGLYGVPFLSEDIMNFQVYTRTGCPYCTKVKQVLQEKVIPLVKSNLIVSLLVNNSMLSLV